MPVSALHGSARRGTASVHLEPVLVRVGLVRSVEMAVVQIVGVVAVDHRPVTAAQSVLVFVLLVLATAHGVLLCDPLSTPRRRQSLR